MKKYYQHMSLIASQFLMRFKRLRSGTVAHKCKKRYVGKYFVTSSFVFFALFSVACGPDREWYNSSTEVTINFLDRYFVYLPEMEIESSRHKWSSAHGADIQSVRFKLPKTQMPIDWLNYFKSSLESESYTVQQLDGKPVYKYQRPAATSNYGHFGYYESLDLYQIEYYDFDVYND